MCSPSEHDHSPHSDLSVSTSFSGITRSDKYLTTKTEQGRKLHNKKGLWSERNHWLWSTHKTVFVHVCLVWKVEGNWLFPVVLAIHGKIVLTKYFQGTCSYQHNKIVGPCLSKDELQWLWEFFPQSNCPTCWWGWDLVLSDHPQTSCGLLWTNLTPPRIIAVLCGLKLTRRELWSLFLELKAPQVSRKLMSYTWIRGMLAILYFLFSLVNLSQRLRIQVGWRI